jgi:diadenosine tetraphosphate (Ap4A) HIT family hydrolase
LDKDEELGVLHREKDFFIVMNKYPYSPGHFMIIPNLHTDKLEELDSQTWMDMNYFAQQGVKLLKDVLNAQGVNLGMNLGKVSGAGIAEHIHLHLVPRWMGDTNFITSVGDTRVYSTDFDKIYKRLKEKAPQYFVCK